MTFRILFVGLVLLALLPLVLPLKNNIEMIEHLIEDERVRMRFVKAYLAHLIRTNRIDDVFDIFEKLRIKHLQFRYYKCIQTMGSEAICNHSVPYYIWAQLIAQAILY